MTSKRRAADPVEKQKELLPVFLSEYEARTAAETVYFDGVHAALDILAGEGWQFAVCTP